MPKIKFIRSFWGNLNNFNQRHRIEINNASKNKDLNEMVYVWGDKNSNYIKSLGFEVTKMSDNETEYGSDFLYDSDVYMIHKLVAIKKGLSQFNKVIFLDWDCNQIKKIDSLFFKLIERQDLGIQMPLYSYPKKYKEIIFKEWKEIPDKEREYVTKQDEYLKKHHYVLNNDFITPNAGFIYCSDSKIIDEILLVNNEFDIKIATEEMAFTEYTKKRCIDLKDYILRYEPLVCDAKYDSHFNQKELNEYISKFIKKDLYFIHE
jgi:hypothetical protein